MAKNDYRREFIMLRQLHGDTVGGFARLEQYTLRASLQFTVSGFRRSNMDTLKGFIAAKDGGNYRFIDVGGLRVDSRGQAGTLYEFDPRFISGLPFEAYSAIGIVQIEDGEVRIPLAGNLYKGAKVDYAELVSAARDWFEPVETNPAVADPVETNPAVMNPVEANPAVTNPAELEPIEMFEDDIELIEAEQDEFEPATEAEGALFEPETEAEVAVFEPEIEAELLIIEPEIGIEPEMIIAEAEPEGEAQEIVIIDESEAVDDDEIENKTYGEQEQEQTQKQEQAEFPEFEEEVADPVPDIMLETIRIPGANDRAEAPLVLPAPEESGEKRGITGLNWPGSSAALKPLFEYNEEFEPFDAPGFRFVRVPLPQASGISYCGIGVQDFEYSARTVCYAIPGVRAAFPPPGLEGYRYKDGSDSGYWVIYQDALTGDTLEADEAEL